MSVDVNKLLSDIQNTSGNSTEISKIATRRNAKPIYVMQYMVIGLGSVLMVLTGMLGGSFFSMDELTVPKALQIISKCMPESWGIKALKDIIFNNASLEAQIQAIVVLGSAGIVGLFVSTILMKIISKTEKGFYH